MLAGSCHCANVRLEVPDRPETLVLCNCSICHRNGALWAFYARDEMRLAGHPQHTAGYVFEPRTITTFHCTGCGCVTHWEPLKPQATMLGVNMRMFDPDELGAARLRRFDGPSPGPTSTRGRSSSAASPRRGSSSRAAASA